MAETLLHVDEGAEALCGRPFGAYSPPEAFGHARWHKPTCAACAAVLTVKRMYGPIRWWDVQRRLQRRADVLAVKRRARRGPVEEAKP